MVINTNSSAVDAASALKRSSVQLSRSLARLSSGSKIINPSDDAAGLAVSEKLEAQSSRIGAAKVNTQNAASLIQTADGFLQTISRVLDRMSELATMAKDVTKNTGDVALYDVEFTELKEQLRDIIGDSVGAAPWDSLGSEPTGSFNGISLFGQRADLTAIIGVSGDQSISIGAIDLTDETKGLARVLWDMSVDPTGVDLSVNSPEAVETLTAAIQQVAEERAGLGAVQSRLNIVDRQLQIQSENLESANSRIRDVDVAEESTSLAKYNILQQAGTSMLAQANALPETVLRLLN